MNRSTIKFDEIINYRVNVNYIINLFYKKQFGKKRTLHRLALQNKTIQNLYKLYNNAILEHTKI